MSINDQYMLIHDKYTHNPDCDYKTFHDTLKERNSPALIDAQESYNRLRGYPVSILGCLEIFEHESNSGKAGVTPRNNTKNPGNVRTSSTGRGTDIFDSERRSTYQKFETWADGWEEIPHRLLSLKYPYHKFLLDGLTVREVIPIWAPPSDNNTPEKYIAAVYKGIAVLAQRVGTMAGPDRYSKMGDIPVVWIPANAKEYSAGRDGYDLIVIHDIEGSAESAYSWLRRPASTSSTHLVTDPLKKRIGQMVGMHSTAHTAGSRKGNSRGINIENPGYAGKPFDPAVVHYCGIAVGVLSRDFGIPLVRLTREQANAPGVKGVCGHGDLDQNGPRSSWHWDPGPTWPWEEMMRIARTMPGAVPGGASPPIDMFPETGFGISGGIRESFKAGGGVLRFGYPISWEYDTLGEDMKPVRVQWFERARAEWRPGQNPQNHDVTWGLLGAEIIKWDAAWLERKWGKETEHYPWAFAQGKQNQPKPEMYWAFK